MPQFLKASDMPTPKLPTAPVGASSAGSSRGFRVNNDFSGTAIPMIDARGFVAADLAQGDIGAAVSGVSNGLAQAVQKRNEMLNQQKVLQAQLSMQQAETDIAAKIANEPDPTKWADIAKQGADAHTKMLLEDKSLSPDAADAIQSQAMRWQSHVTTTAQIQSVHRGRQLLGEQLHANAINAAAQGDFNSARGFWVHGGKEGVFASDQVAKAVNVLNNQEKEYAIQDGMNTIKLKASPENRDWAGAEHVVTDLEKRGLLRGPDAALKRSEISSARDSDEIKQMVATNPYHAYDVIQQSDTEGKPTFKADASPYQRKQWLDEAMAGIADSDKQSTMTLQNAISSGAVKTPQGVDDLVGAKMSPHLVQGWKGKIAGMTLDEPAYASAAAAIRAIDVAKDSSSATPNLIRSKMEAEIQAGFPDAQSKQLLKLLDDHYKEPESAQKQAEALGEKSLMELLHAGAFGATKRPIVDEKTGLPLTTKESKIVHPDTVERSILNPYRWFGDKTRPATDEEKQAGQKVDYYAPLMQPETAEGQSEAFTKYLRARETMLQQLRATGKFDSDSVLKTVNDVTRDARLKMLRDYVPTLTKPSSMQALNGVGPGIVNPDLLPKIESILK